MRHAPRALAACAAAATLVLVQHGDSVRAAPGTSTSTPVSSSVWVPCAADGAGELVVLGGDLHVTVHSVQRSATSWTSTSSVNPQGVVGTGQLTGDVYRGAGHTGATTVSTPNGLRSVQTNSFRLIGPGPGNNLLAHATWHITERADGSLVGAVDNVSLECR